MDRVFLIGCGTFIPYWFLSKYTRYTAEKEIRWQEIELETLKEWSLHPYEGELGQKIKAEYEKEIEEREAYVSELRAWRNQWLWKQMGTNPPKHTKYSDYVQ